MTPLSSTCREPVREAFVSLRYPTPTGKRSGFGNSLNGSTGLSGTEAAQPVPSAGRT